MSGAVGVKKMRNLLREGQGWLSGVKGTERTEDEPLEPVTPIMLVEQLARLGIGTRCVNFSDWTQDERDEAFDWAVEVDSALIDGAAISIRKRPVKLTAVIF
jgi:hypothetical protein